MSMNKEYERLINGWTENLPKRMCKVIGECPFTGFFTHDGLSIGEAEAHDKELIPEGTRWGEKWEYGWFFTEITIPSEAEGKRVGFMAELGECIVFVNGEVYGSLDREHKMITLTANAAAGEKFKIAMEVYAGHMGGKNPILVDHYKMVIPEEKEEEFAESGVTQKVSQNGRIVVFYENIFHLWMDIKTLYDLSRNLGGDSLRRAQIEKGLKRMCDTVDIELPLEEFEKEADKGRELLKPLFDCKNGSTVPELFAIGNSHLDLEWLWTVDETRRKSARTLGNQLKIIEEYPEYKYIQSQPWILETVKNKYPDLYAKVKKAVKDGNIIPEGGTWVQPDTNITSGESLIRQFMTGKKFIMDEFGYDSKLFWLPDSFGISGALPQIMKGCGIEYFMNAKLHWQYNGGDPLPHSVFMWKGIDGTELLTTIISGYAAMTNPSAIINQWHMNHEKENIPVRLFPFGHGDGGGGATRAHLEYLRRERNLEGMPKVTQAAPNEFFEYVKENCPPEKKYVGELYYSSHRGSYTSQAKTKKLNRQSEYALREAEMWCALFDKKEAKSNIDSLWKTLLFNQFHDILPGTSITKVHEITEKELSEVVSEAKALAENSTSAVISDRADSITVFNSLSWDRRVKIELPDGYTSVEGYPSQKIGGKYFAQVEVPACGYKSFKLGNGTGAEEKTGGELILENDLIRAEFNGRGEIISVVDKETDTEYLDAPSNVFRMYRDMPMFFDAWDIDSCYEKDEVDMGNSVSVMPQYRGAVASGLVVKRSFGKSAMTQTISIEKGSKCIRFDTEVDWQETHRLLKVDFNTNINTDEMLSETQFGYVKRPTHKNRQYDADRFEVCQHKWSVLAEGKRGAAVLNDCKYGISADGGRMSLTLLKSSVRPAFKADKGVHHFTYSFMPFGGAFVDSDVVRNAYELNCPVIVRKGYADEKSFLKVSEDNVIIDTVKMAEDGSGDLIVRMYESKNTHTVCKLSADFDIKEAYITDMLENKSEKAKCEGNEISLQMRAFEIVTLRLTVDRQR